MLKSFFVNASLRSASLISNIIMIISVSFILSDNDQGVFYFIQSLVALNFFFDLGIGFVLANLAGASKSKSIVSIKLLSINEMNELKSIIKFGSVWLTASSLVYFIVVSLIGTYFLLSKFALTYVQIFMWVLLVFSNSLNLVLGNFLSLIEGFGFSKRAAACRFVQASTNSITFLALSIIYNSPFAIGMSFFISVIFCFVFSILLYKHEIIHTITWRTKSKITWYKDIFPFQWRIAISWLSGYFMFQAPTLALSLSGRIEDAGHLGLSLQIYFAFLSICQVYLILCVPRWTSKIRNGDSVTKDFFYSCLTTCILFTMISISMPIFTHFYPEENFSKRLIGSINSTLLLIGTLGFLIFICGNFYFRAHIEEKLWGVSIVGASAMVGGIFWVWDEISSAWISILFCGVGLLSGCVTLLLVSWPMLQTRSRNV